MTQADQQLTRFRLQLITRLLPFLFILILIRLFYWQIIRGPQLAAKAVRQHQSTSILQARRGNIYDSNGQLLAGVKDLYHLYLYRPEFTSKETDLISLLSPILATEPPPASPGATPITKQDMIDITRDFLFDRLSLTSNWISLKHYLTPEQKETIESLNLKGLGFDPEFVRFYPESSMAAHILGFVGKDLAGQEQGYFGLEGYFDRHLKGRSGKVRTEKDAYGNPILIGHYRLLQSQHGGSLTTTIDKGQQFIVESLLKEGLVKYQAKAGTVTVLETKTGQIKALASFPNYDPGHYSDFNKEHFKNPIVANLFEPGSIFKPLIMAAALNEKVITPDTQCTICSGPIYIGQFSIKTWNDQYHPQSSMTEVIINSDNTGMVFVSQKLGKDKFLEYLKAYNLDQKTDIELQEESSGQPKTGRDFRDIDLATNAFGQGIALTRIQMLTAFNVIANQGYLIKPTLISSIDNQEALPSQPKKILAESAVKQITQMMVEAVDKGEAKWAKPKNISIAGKTGTAQIPIEGHYDPDKTIASFIGFFPANNPQYTMLVTLTEPQTSPWGSETAAPLWFAIAKQLLL